jgi:ATP-dependent DNA ligase
VPTSADARQLWEQWTAWGGEGIVLKVPDVPYRPGERTRAWLKLKAGKGSDVDPALLAKARAARHW